MISEAFIGEADSQLLVLADSSADSWARFSEKNPAPPLPGGCGVPGGGESRVRTLWLQFSSKPVKLGPTDRAETQTKNDK